MRKRMSILLQRTAPTAGLRRIRIFIFANRTPDRWNLFTGTWHQYRHEEGSKLSRQRQQATRMCDDRGSEIGGWGKRRNGKGKGTDEVICCCLAVSYEACTRFADTYARTTEILT